jgi:serine phosphatase RsbU (regulator of sigma subunit)
VGLFYNQPAMPSTQSQGGNDLIGRLAERVNRAVKSSKSFWQRVSEGIEVQQLWSQFKTEARASYELYSKEVDWASLESESRWKWRWRMARALFWAMIMKLSPARRVFLLMALVFAVVGLINIRFVVGSVNLQLSGGQFPLLLAVGALVLLLALELADRVTMKRDLEIAREIQRWLVPEVPPQVPGVDVAFATRAANTVAGDYYDAFLRNSEASGNTSPPLLLAVADVAGKSVPAALLMATFQASLHTLASAPTSLLGLVAGLNRYACAHSLGGQRFTTAFLAELEPATGALTYVSAGHNPPVLRRLSRNLERLEAGGLPLGIQPEARYESGSTTLYPGDLLVIFTDGLVEAENERGEEYGESRLLELLRSTADGSAAQDLKTLVDSVESFVGSAPQHDDLTCLVLRRV